MRAYRPEIQIKLGGAEITEMVWGDRAACRVSKSLQAPMGEMVLTLPDLPTNDNDSLYGFVSPMQPIEIAMRRAEGVESGFFGGGLSGGELTTVFRGVVRSIGRTEQIDGQGRPQRFVQLSAHDCGAFFVMEQLSKNITFQNKGVMTARYGTYLTEYLQGNDPNHTAIKAGDFLRDVALKTTEPMMAAAGYSWEFLDLSGDEDGYVWPTQALSQEGAIWSILDRHRDGPWNELFVREGESKPQLVYRTTPWRNMDGGWLEGTSGAAIGDVEFVPIPKADVNMLSAHRDDAELVNHVWTNSALSMAAGTLAPFNQDGIVNGGTRDQFGDRLATVTTYQLPQPTVPINLPRDQQREAETGLQGWLTKRQRWMKAAGQDTHNFERGVLQTKGRPHYRIGDYLTFQRSALNSALHWDGYITRVTHDFRAFDRYVTTIEYMRSNQWVKRLGAVNPYWVERQRGIEL